MKEMKLIRLLITVLSLLFLFHGSVFGEEDAIGLVIDENANAGIGTETPMAKLDVVGPIIIDNGNHGATTFNAASFYGGDEGSYDYIHIQLPFNADTDRRMYHIRARGYAYSGADNARIVDITWVGYCYRGHSFVYKPAVIDLGSVSSRSDVTQYVGAVDKLVYLRFQPNNTAWLTFTVDSMFVGGDKFGQVIKPGEVNIIQSPSEYLGGE